MRITIIDSETNLEISDGDELMTLSGQDYRMGFESIAIQEDKTIIICDKCGNFGYLPEKFKLEIRF